MSTELAMGTITGIVTEAESGGPLTGAEVNVQGTALRAMTDVQGQYKFSIVQGTHIVQVTTFGRQSGEKTVSVLSGGTTTTNFSLAVAPRNIDGPMAN
jgi:hypothetical protein